MISLISEAFNSIASSSSSLLRRLVLSEPYFMDTYSSSRRQKNAVVLSLLDQRFSHTAKLRFQTRVVYSTFDSDNHSAQEAGVNLNGRDDRFLRQAAECINNRLEFLFR